jgi:hypothetical protein
VCSEFGKHSNMYPNMHAHRPRPILPPSGLPGTDPVHALTLAIRLVLVVRVFLLIVFLLTVARRTTGNLWHGLGAHACSTLDARLARHLGYSVAKILFGS